MTELEIALNNDRGTGIRFSTIAERIVITYNANERSTNDGGSLFLP